MVWTYVQGVLKRLEKRLHKGGEEMINDRKITPDELHNIILGFHNGTTVECPRHCTGCKLENVCDDIMDIVCKLTEDMADDD